jgi:hypothetical protein
MCAGLSDRHHDPVFLRYRCPGGPVVLYIPDFIYSVLVALCCSSCSMLLSRLIYAVACDLMICCGPKV